MTKSRLNKMVERLEHRIWELIKPVYKLNQRYQRQPFGRMTSVHVLAKEISRSNSRNGKTIK